MDQAMEELLLGVTQRLDELTQSMRPDILAAYGKLEPDIKADNTPVTELDRQAEQRFRDCLSKYTPDFGIVGEEYGGNREHETFWLIDPIDGTESFIRGLPFTRQQLTLIHQGEPVYAYIYKPITDDRYLAYKGKGATKNDHPIKVGTRPLSRSWVDFSTAHYENPDVSRLISAIYPAINNYRVIGDYTLVAEGRVDVSLAYKAGGDAWDYAPRALLLSEAGAIVKNIGSDSYDYRNFDFLAASPVIFDELHDLIKRTIAGQ